MLSKEQKKILREIEIYDSHFQEVPGEPIVTEWDCKVKHGLNKKEGDKYPIPDFKELYYQMVQKIKKAGFSSVKKVSPSKANVIVRVFLKKNVQYDSKTYYFYGAFTYVKKVLFFYADNTHSTNLSFNSKECPWEIWFFYDDSLVVNMDFKDFYLKVDK